MTSKTVQRECLVEYDGNGVPTGNVWINGVKITDVSGLDALSPSPRLGASVKITVKRQVFLDNTVKDIGASATFTAEFIDQNGDVNSDSCTSPSTGMGTY